jgi:Fe-S-cluster containining protein
MTAKKKNRVNVNFELNISGDTLKLEAPVLDAKTSAVELIPAFQAFTNQVVELSIKLTERQGKTISCKAGCGACCKQPVPVTLLEVEHIDRVVKKMPEQKQQQVRAIFAHHLKVVEEAGLLEKLKSLPDLESDQRHQLAADYFKLGLECPFLENQSCGIYKDRPLECREFLVTSDPRHCAALDPLGIEHIDQQLHMASALRKLSIDSQNADDRGWVLMIFALELAKSGRLRFKKKSSKEWVKTYIQYAIDKPVP